MMFHSSQFYIYIFATDDFNIFRNYFFAAQCCIVFAAHCFTRAYFATWRYSCIVCALPTLMLTFPNTSAMSSFLDSVFLSSIRFMYRNLRSVYNFMKCLFTYILKLYEYFTEIPMKLNYNLTSYDISL